MTRKRNLPTGLAVISLRLPEDLHERVKEMAKQADRTVSQEMRQAIRAHVEQAESEIAA